MSTDSTNPELVSDILSLACEIVIPAEVIALWTVAERDAAVAWAGAEHFSASGNPGVKRLLKPWFLTRAEEIVSSRAQAQLAAEAWAGRDSTADFAVNPVHLANLAREALTGLTVLLGERQPS